MTCVCSGLAKTSGWSLVIVVVVVIEAVLVSLERVYVSGPAVYLSVCVALCLFW